MSSSPQWYEMCCLIAGKDFEKAEAFLIRNPSLQSEVNGIGETVLHYQAVENDEEGVSWLYSHGFDINTKNQFGRPVVFEVAQLDNKSLLQWFISHGADLKCRDRDGNTIKEYLVEYWHEPMAKYLESLNI